MIRRFRALSMAALLAAPPAAAQPAPDVVDSASLPLPADALVAARAFALDEPRPYPWMADHPPIQRGLLLAVDAQPALCLPRQVAEPVVYLGAVPAERLAADWEEGRLLLLVPGEPDPAALPLHFGAPDLPERIDVEAGAEALALARAAGVKPFEPQQVQAARVVGGPDLTLADPRALDHAIADFIDAWAPAQHERAEGLRAPAP
jgi:nucleotide-binding universal stress UspA family protein